MATSRTAIANGALQRLGAKRIETLSENSPNARSMNAAIDRVLKAEMRRYDWGFAIKRASIAADATNTTWGSWKRYSKPADMLRLLRDDESGERVDWRIEGDYIVSADSSPLEIRYIAFIEDPNFYDALFVEAVECKLAMVCCKEITGSHSEAVGVKKDYADAIAEARRTGAIEEGAKDFPEDDWVSARL